MRQRIVRGFRAPLLLALVLPALSALAQDLPPGGPPAGMAIEGMMTSGGPGQFGMTFVRYEEAFNGKVVTGQPYSATAVTERIQVLADGNKIDQTNDAKEYRDSEGRTRRERTSAPMGPWGAAAKGLPPLVAINDPVAGVGYLLDSTNKVAHQHPLRSPDKMRFGMAKARAGAVRMSPGKLVGGAEAAEKKTEDLGVQVINGVSAQGTRTTVTIPAGGIGNQQPIVIVDERWVAPDLQLLVQSKHSDPRFGEVNYSLTNINRAEPDATMFQVPSDYTVKEGRGGHDVFFEAKPDNGN